MTVDWITVSAQVINFLVLVALLRRFLYRPVLDAMQHREALIAKDIQDAKQLEAEAQAEKLRWLEAQRELAQESAALRAKVEQESAELREQLRRDAQREFDALRADKLQTLAQESDRLQLRLHQELAGAAADAARRALADLADETLEQRMIARFIHELAEPDGLLVPQSHNPKEPLRITTAFPLDAITREALTAALQRQDAGTQEPEFALDPALICGLELSSAGSKLGWTINDYFDDLAVRLHRAITPDRARDG